MKQKILKLLAAPALLLAAGITLSGCVNDFAGTQRNYEEKKQEITDNLGTVDAAWTGYVYCGSGSLEQAEKQSHVTLQISSPTKLDMSTVDSAITFYKLKDNTDDPTYYPMHDGELTKEQVGVSVSESWDDYAQNGGNSERGVRTTIKYDVNTEDVTTNRIALIVDATKLKDVFGNFVLNRDGNYKAGQESDSWIKYIWVNRKSDGTSTTGLSGLHDENFCYVFVPFDTNTLAASVDSATGKLSFTMDAEAKNEAGTEYDDALASTLHEYFTLRTISLQETAYKDVPLTWTYEAGQYKATTADALSYGTKYSLVQVMKPYTAPEWIAKVYGHPGFTDFAVTGAKEEISACVGESNVITEQPDTIVDDPSDPDNSGDSWAPSTYDTADVIGYQNALLHVIRNRTQVGSEYISGYYDENGNWVSGHTVYYYYYKWEISPESGVTLKSYNDFIVTDSDYNKLDIEMSFVNNSDENNTIRTIYIELKKPVSEPILWVGNGTVLDDGINTAYPKQVKFGSPYKSILMGDASGYVPLRKDN